MKHICSHHVGGRGGSRAFPILPCFEKDLVNVLYDADADCVQQIEDRNRSLESNLLVLPYCIGGKDTDEVLFNINYDPCASSLRQMNERYASWYFYFRRDRYDYIVKDTFKTVEKRKQRLITLDQLLKEDDSIVPPDVLSLDAQGSEYEILEGAGNTLSSNVLAIITEVEFRPLYDGQKLFGDICDLSRSQGFEFVKFLKGFGEYTPYRGPIGLRAEGFHTVGEALFLRDIDDLRRIEDKYLCSVMLDKLAFIAIVFGQFEYALECIDRGRICRQQQCPDEQDQEYSYIKLLREIEDELERYDNRFPQTFSERYSVHQSMSRFKVKTEEDQSQCSQTDQSTASTVVCVSNDDSNIEKILRKHSLDSQADLIKKRRLKES